MRLKTLFKTVFLLAIAFGSARFCHHQTHGFRLSKIANNTPLHPQKAFAENVPPQLQQKFRYFAKGKQSFAFLSEDGEYVLKIFNNTYQRKIHLFHALSYLPFIKTWAEAKKHYFKYKLEKTFESYRIAMDQMQQETGLTYAHLSCSENLPNQLILIDPLNIEHSINPNGCGFLLQKKVTLAYPHLKKIIDDGKPEQAKEAIHSLISLFFWKFHHGIADNDPLIRTNYGFSGTQAYQIDVGPLSLDNSLKEIERQKVEIARIASSLKNWLNQNAPELIPFLDRELEDQLSSGNETAL